ncbi:MAG: hypothetical protein HY696_00940 [Deltaproteobacteria bacterium]|nr:hypothetical protein [Deltaproteobacteria bacterium]
MFLNPAIPKMFTPTKKPLEEAFSTLLSRLELNPTRVRLASERYDAIKTHLESRLQNVEVKQVGSFRKKTKIRPGDGSDRIDLDVIVCLGNFTGYSDFPGVGVTPNDALRAVQDALKDNAVYRMMRPRIDAPTIALDYNDDFSVELIPCYRDLSGRYPRLLGPACYVVGATGNWEPADYDYDAEYLTQLNQSSDVDGRLIPAIKITKAFLRNHGISIKSFFIEIVCAQHLPNVLRFAKLFNTDLGYARHLYIVLDKLADNLGKQLSFLESHTPPVESGLNPLEELFTKGRLKKLAQDARALCNTFYSTALMERWSDFFGSPFPRGKHD